MDKYNGSNFTAERQFQDDVVRGRGADELGGDRGRNRLRKVEEYLKNEKEMENYFSRIRDKTRHDGNDISTTQRNYKFTEDGFSMSRSYPVVPQPSLRIGIEGDREFSPEKLQEYRAYSVRDICSARPGGRFRSASLTTGRAVEGPLVSRTEFKDQFNSFGKHGSLSPNSTVSSMSDRSIPSSGSGSSPTHPYTRSRPIDSRFSAGSTTRSTYRDFSGSRAEARPKPVLPSGNLRMEGDFSREVSSKEHYPELPYSRTPAFPRKESLKLSRGRLETATTYKDFIDEETRFNNLRRTSRYDYSLRIPDKLDWL
ncbi:uncharacterized protein LOC111709419 [Eurytemora carolleeae]|uniref:uncharacterized protein LOC111709419 n=1 Tax=Eurytemora carolleeae TaxID=1294199 RepID=UPI000C768947|nr:uncharacterized protein LOC111709419 [Eurytemora carolleeae]|eukprot:XP_023338849.1 uncharacterized protein LOC111709419 [Eurytemora affinis]